MIKDRHQLSTHLANLGDCVKTNITINTQATMEQILYQWPANNSAWQRYNVDKHGGQNPRWVLPLTSYDGSLHDITSRNSLRDMGVTNESQLCQPTPVFRSVSEAQRIISLFRNRVGRCNILRADAGGFWPPHRDYYSMPPEYFRIVCWLNTDDPGDFHFNMDERRFQPQMGHFYYMNFQKTHSLFSFTNSVYMMLLTLELVPDNVQVILENLTYR